MGGFGMKVLIIEDEEAIANLVKINLSAEGYQCTCAYDGTAGADYLEKETFDLILLDIMLPEIDGYELLEYIKPFGTPVIFMTAKGAVNDRIRGLKLGADDYIVKPFLPKEFLLRVTALLRRTYGNILPESGFSLPDSVCKERTIRFDTATVQCGEEEIALTPKELILLKVLYGQKNRIVTSDALTMAAWGDTSYGYENTLMVHIRRLRQKIEENPSSPRHLLTVKGLGYKLIVKG